MAIYNFALWVAFPFVKRRLASRLESGKEDRLRFSERKGEAIRSRPGGELIWIHAASLGESLSVLPLVNGLLAVKPARSILVTTGTVTSAKLMEDRLPDGAFHQYVPIDKKEYVLLFLNYWRPNLAIWVESEIWPNLINETSKLKIPMMMVNGRMTKKSYDIWRKVGGLGKQLVSKFDYCHCQNEISAARLSTLGAKEVECLGNLKYCADSLPFQKDTYLRMLDVIGIRKTWMAASTHPGEEGYIVEAHKSLKQANPNLLTIIVPRHPERGDDIALKIESAGYSVVQRSKGKIPSDDTEFYIADTIGEMGIFYNLVDVVFIGGSLVQKGGQNPLEPARLKCAIVCGPHMDNFVEVIADLLHGKGAIIVQNLAELTKVVGELLGDTQKRHQLAENAFTIVKSGETILTKILTRTEALLKKGKS